MERYYVGGDRRPTAMETVNNSARKEITGLTRITKKRLKELCKKDKLYQTPALNDVLYLHYQGFECIECLDEYTGLKCLWLESNAISEIQGLEYQPQLKCLFLQSNLIKRIENLEHCAQLDTLNLASNHIRKIENCGVDVLPQLNTLNLASNYLKDVDSLRELENCKTLSVLDLSNNRIDDILVVKVFAKMPQLRVLVLQGNPVVSKLPQYRKTLILECKELTYLDSRPVFPKDRACAEAWKSGGYEAERKENERWNRMDRRKIRDSVNATIRMRNRHKPADQQDPLFNSSDSEEDRAEAKRLRNAEVDAGVSMELGIWDEVAGENSSETSSDMNVSSSTSVLSTTDSNTNVSMDSKSADLQNNIDGEQKPQNNALETRRKVLDIAGAGNVESILNLVNASKTREESTNLVFEENVENSEKVKNNKLIEEIVTEEQPIKMEIRPNVEQTANDNTELNSTEETPTEEVKETLEPSPLEDTIGVAAHPNESNQLSSKRTQLPNLVSSNSSFDSDEGCKEEYNATVEAISKITMNDLSSELPKKRVKLHIDVIDKFDFDEMEVSHPAAEDESKESMFYVENNQTKETEQVIDDVDAAIIQAEAQLKYEQECAQVNQKVVDDFEELSTNMDIFIVELQKEQEERCIDPVEALFGRHYENDSTASSQTEFDESTEHKLEQRTESPSESTELSSNAASFAMSQQNVKSEVTLTVTEEVNPTPKKLTETINDVPPMLMDAATDESSEQQNKFTDTLDDMPLALIDASTDRDDCAEIIKDLLPALIDIATIEGDKSYKNTADIENSSAHGNESVNKGIGMSEVNPTEGLKNLPSEALATEQNVLARILDMVDETTASGDRADNSPPMLYSTKELIKKKESDFSTAAPSKAYSTFEQEEHELRKLLQQLEDENEKLYNINSAYRRILEEDIREEIKYRDKESDENTEKFCEEIVNDLLEELTLLEPKSTKPKSYEIGNIESDDEYSYTEQPTPAEMPQSSIRSVLTSFNELIQEIARKNKRELERQDEERATRHMTSEAQKTESLHSLLKSPILKDFNGDTNESLDAQINAAKDREKQQLQKLVDRVYAQKDKYNDTLEVVDGKLVVVKKDTGEIEELPESKINYSDSEDEYKSAQSDDEEGSYKAAKIWEGKVRREEGMWKMPYHPTHRIPAMQLIQQANELKRKEDEQREEKEKAQEEDDEYYSLDAAKPSMFCRIDEEFFDKLDFDNVEVDDEDEDHVVECTRSYEELKQLMNLKRNKDELNLTDDENILLQKMLERAEYKHSVSKESTTDPLTEQENELLQKMLQRTKEREKEKEEAAVKSDSKDVKMSLSTQSMKLYELVAEKQEEAIGDIDVRKLDTEYPMPQQFRDMLDPDEYSNLTARKVPSVTILYQKNTLQNIAEEESGVFQDPLDMTPGGEATIYSQCGEEEFKEVETNFDEAVTGAGGNVENEVDSLGEVYKDANVECDCEAESATRRYKDLDDEIGESLRDIVDSVLDFDPSRYEEFGIDKETALGVAAYEKMLNQGDPNMVDTFLDAPMSERELSEKVLAALREAEENAAKVEQKTAEDRKQQQDDENAEIKRDAIVKTERTVIPFEKYDEAHISENIFRLEREQLERQQIAALNKATDAINRLTEEYRELAVPAECAEAGATTDDDTQHLEAYANVSTSGKKPSHTEMEKSHSLQSLLKSPILKTFNADTSESLDAQIEAAKGVDVELLECNLQVLGSDDEVLDEISVSAELTYCEE